MLACLGAGLLIAHRRWGRWPLLLGLGWFVAVLLTPVAAWVSLPLEDRFPRAPAPARVDGVIILGGAVEQLLTESRGIPSLNGAAERMTEAVALSRRFPQARILFTGGSGNPLPGQLSEADVARQLFASLGLEGERVLFEAQSRNTWENATMTRAMIPPRPGRALAARHLGEPHAAQHGLLPPRGMGGGGVAGELFDAARRRRLVRSALVLPPGPGGVGDPRICGPRRLPPAGPHGRAVSGALEHVSSDWIQSGERSCSRKHSF
jgi:uncharacterized SAM-binding protein YcdF (DUF218 family)